MYVISRNPVQWVEFVASTVVPPLMHVALMMMQRVSSPAAATTNGLCEGTIM